MPFRARGAGTEVYPIGSGGQDGRYPPFGPFPIPHGASGHRTLGTKGGNGELSWSWFRQNRQLRQSVGACMGVDFRNVQAIAKRGLFGFLTTQAVRLLLRSWLHAGPSAVPHLYPAPQHVDSDGTRQAAPWGQSRASLGPSMQDPASELPRKTPSRKAGE